MGYQQQKPQIIFHVCIFGVGYKRAHGVNMAFLAGGLWHTISAELFVSEKNIFEQYFSINS